MGQSSGHTPVMLRQVLELALRPEGGVVLDCTMGLGGHAEAILGDSPESCCYIGLDRDETNLKLAAERLDEYRKDTPPRLRLFHARFSEAPTALAEVGVKTVDTLLADIGVASTHLDDPQRGFSFQQDGPLDMRMDGSEGRTAADIVNKTNQRDLADLIYQYGEERRSRRVADFICRRRTSRPFATTGDLAGVVAAAVGRGGKIHPATRTFQALRIAVNDELGELERLLECLPRIVRPGGRAVVISFHSLEDRLVKKAFSSMKMAFGAKIITPKPWVPDDEEINGNPRSRSARLRCIEMSSVVVRSSV